MEQKVGDLLKKNNAYDEENTRLKNKLSESMNNIDNLKKYLKELILRMCRLLKIEKGMMVENTKMKLKLHIKGNIFNKMEAETKDLKAEIVDLKTKMEGQGNEVLLQQKVGLHKAINQVLVSTSELKPRPSWIF
jgi:acetolactate synthase small subunit